MKISNRRHVAGIFFTCLIALPIVAPSAVLAGLDKALWFLDQHTERVGLPPSGGWLQGLWCDACDLATDLVRSSLSEEDSFSLPWRQRDQSFQSKEKALARWLRNRGFPTEDEMMQRSKLSAPSMSLFEGDSETETPVSNYLAWGIIDDPGLPVDDLSVFSMNGKLEEAIRDRLLMVVPDLADRSTRREFVAQLKEFPAICRLQGGGDALHLEIGFTSSRRALFSKQRDVDESRMSISACLEKYIPECEWKGSGAIVAETLLALIQRCREGTAAGIDRGLDLMPRVEDELALEGIEARTLMR